MNLLGTKTLETERLILRKYELSDANDMYNNWGTDKKTLKKQKVLLQVG